MNGALYASWLRARPSPQLDAAQRRILEALPSGPAIGMRSISVEQGTIDLLVRLCKVTGHILWLSLDDSTKRFSLLEFK